MQYSLALHNSGSADAAVTSLTDRVGREPERAVAGRPDEVAAGQSVVALHSYAIPGSRAPGPLGDTATVEWEDRNDNRYGPLTDTHTTEVTRPAPPPADANPSPRPSDQFDFLFSGENPIQTGVSDGTIKPLTISVLRGSVRTRAGAPLAGVKVSVIDHPEYGETQTQADGEFYLAVNAGQHRLRFEKDGYIAIERKLTAHARDYAFSEDVALVQRDSAATAVQFASTTSTAQVHRATTMSDEDGTRAVTFVVQPGTEATMRMPDGSTQPLTAGTVRATEFTVGASGEAAMPAELPPTTAYTFAADFSIDQAEDAGAEEVRFSKPIAGYLENFLSIPVGELVPAGTYDEQRGAWLADSSGRVVKVLSETDGTAQLDVDGSGQAASQTQLDALGITTQELQRVAELYDPGAQLWRVPVDHFSWPDWNYPPPATDPAAGPPTGTIGPDAGDCGSTASGSIIGCEDQTLGEVFALTGAPFALHYQSERMPGRTAENTLEIPLSGDSLPGPVDRIEVEVEVAGKRIQLTRPPDPNQSYTFTWDGKDAFGRTIDTAPVTVRVGYAYEGRYRGTSGFGQPPGATSLSYPMSATRRETVFWQVFRRTLGRPGARDAALGGMTLSVHHAYDTVTRTLYLGSGGRRSAQSLVETISNFAGNGQSPSSTQPNGDGGPATSAPTTGNAVTYAPDGSVYIAEGGIHRIRRVGPDGVIETVAGTGVRGSAGDGGPATSAQLDQPNDVDLGPDGSLYIAEHGGDRIRRVRPDGIIETVRQTELHPVGVAVAPDGTVYYSANGRNNAGGFTNYSMIGRISPDGLHNYVVPPEIFQSDGDGGLASEATVYQVGDLDLAPDGSLYITERRGTYGGRNVVRRITPDGVIDRVAGTGEPGNGGDGGPALDATLAPQDVAVAADGTLYIGSCSNGCRVRRVASDGTIATAGGGGSASGPAYGDGGPARQAELAATSVDVAPDGSLYVGDGGHSRVRRVTPPLPGYTDGELAIASTDGTELYVFDRDGRHLETKSTLTGATLWAFSYENGRLSDVTDGDGNNTYVERAPDGRATGIVAPDGERTRFTSTADGLIGSVTDPAGGSFGLTYRTGGLLELLRDPEGHDTIFDYDGRGRLIRDDDAAGGYQTLSRADARDQFEVTRQTRLGLATKYKVASSADGTTTKTVTGPGGLATTTERRSDGSTRRTQPDGSTLDAVQAGDPRYGMQAAFPGSVTGTTPGGLGATVTTSRSVTRPEPDNPLSLSTLTESRTSAGKTATTVFDRSLSRVTFTSPAGRTQATTVDAQGRPVAATVPGVNPVSYTYDQRGRLQLVTQGERFQRYAYDERGNVESTTDATGRVTRYAYDAANRVTATTLPDARVISFAYDRNGDLVSVTPPSRPAHELGRTPLRALGHYTAPDAGQGADQTSYVYDFDRRLTGVTRPDGKQLTLGYDAAGRLDAVTEPDARTTSLTYDAQTGSLKRVTTPDGVVTELGFDGPLPTSTTASGPVAGAVAQGYDGEWRLNEATVNGQDPVAYAYDQDDLLTGAGDLALARRPDNGLLAGSTLGSLTTSHGYDAYGDLESHDAAYAQQSVFAQTFQRDAAGRITSKTEVTSTGSHTYAYRYDQAGRLEEVSRDGGQAITSYSYDANGNRSSVTRDGVTTSASYDAQDRLSAYGGVQYEYTRAGELLRKTDGQAVTAYDYDTLGNLDRVELPDGQPVDYLWDGLGRRVGRKVDGQLTHGWLWGEWDGPVAELDAQGAVRSRFAYGTRSNVPDYMVRDGRTYRIVTDHLASPRLVIDTATGEIAQELDYDEYGRTLRDTNPGFQPFGYAGGLYDTATGLVRFGARDYDPETGRWTSKDPVLFAGGDTNLYGYVLIDPINHVDPSGLVGVPGFIEDAGSFASNTAAGALNEITFGGSNRLAGALFGFDPDCAQFGSGYGLGNLLGGINPKGAIKGAIKGVRGIAGGARGGGGGGIVIKGDHGGRHLPPDLDQGAVEDAIRQRVAASTRGSTVEGWFEGRLTVDGQSIQYRGYGLPDGTINVGTYFPPKP